jgi:hypothetical protein
VTLPSVQELLGRMRRELELVEVAA